MSVLMHLSDTHFGAEQQTVVDAALRLHRELRPDLVVFSGDITQRARRLQFARAREFVERLRPTPVLAVPGNHDIPLFDLLRRWLAPYRRYRSVFGKELQPQWQNEDIVVIGVNTTRPARHIDGEISTQQIDHVCARLAAAHSKQLRIVVVHQPVDACRIEDECNLLIGHCEAVRAWAKAGADLVLGGHVHLPFARPLRLRYGADAGAMWVVQAGTSLSTRVRAGKPNSLNVIRSDGERRAVIERRDYDAVRARFACAGTAAFPDGVGMVC
jgi:3',5'-cyclic AMP phosphodiesterase CpdA